MNIKDFVAKADALNPISDQEICDFCSGTRPVKDYACLSFTVSVIKGFEGTPNELHTVSDGAWGACATCAALIDEEKWDDLLERSLKQLWYYEKLEPSARQALRKHMRNMHQQFRKNRIRAN